MNDAAVAPARLQERAPGKLAASGALTFATAKAARDSWLAMLERVSARAIEVDCSGIGATDSAGMTVLLDWLAAAKQAGRSMHFANLPAQLQAIAKISDVLELLEQGV